MFDDDGVATIVMLNSSGLLRTRKKKKMQEAKKQIQELANPLFKKQVFSGIAVIRKSKTNNSLGPLY